MNECMFVWFFLYDIAVFGNHYLMVNNVDVTLHFFVLELEMCRHVVTVMCSVGLRFLGLGFLTSNHVVIMLICNDILARLCCNGHVNL